MRVKPLLASLAVAALVVIAGGFGAYHLTDVTYETTPRIPSVVPSTPESVPPTTSSSEAPPPPVKELVAQAMPTSFSVWKEGEAPLLGLTGINPNPAVANDYTGRVGLDDVASIYVQNDPRLDWAVLPGTGVGTTILLCHTLAGGDLPCNALGTIPPGDATSSGYRAKLELPTGTLTAELTYVHTEDKTKSKDWPVLFTKEADRWLVGMCRLERNPATGTLKNTYEFVFLEFHLIESISRH